VETGAAAVEGEGEQEAAAATGETGASPNEMEPLKQTHIKDLTNQRGKIKAIDEKYNAMKKDELGVRDSRKFPDLGNLYKDLNSKVDSILKNLDLVDENRFAVLESIKKIRTLKKLNEYLEGEKKTQDEAFSTLFTTIDSEETEINEMKTKLDSKVSAAQQERANRISSQEEDDELGKDVEEENPQSVASGNMSSEEIAGETVNNDKPPEIGANSSVEDAKRVFLPYLDKEIKRLNQGKEVLSKDSNNSEDKNELMSHYENEISIVGQKRENVVKWNKDKPVSDLQSKIIQPEAIERRSRKDKEKTLLAKIDPSTTNEGENEVVKTKQPGKKNEQGIARESEQINTEKTASQILDEAKRDLQHVSSEINESSGSQSPETANASTATGPLQNSGDGVTAAKIDMVCTELKARIEEVQKEIKKLEESKKGGRKSRTNNKKKKSKAKKNKTRRRRRSKA
jgi:hypothetical protein